MGKTGYLRNKILAGLFALALLGPAGPLPAPTPAFAAGVVGTGFAQETLTVSSTALSITATLCLERGRQTPALLEVLDNGIYFTLDSPTATPDSGDYAAAVGTVISVEKANYIRMIRQSVDTAVKVTCFRGGQLPTENSFDKSGTGITGAGGTVLQASSIDDTDVHATGTTVVINMGAVAVPTDTAVSANDIGMVAMSLDRRALVDADVVLEATADITIQIADSDAAGNAGTNSAQTLRVTVATDDEINDDLDAIRVATELIDNAVYAEDTLAVNVDPGLAVFGIINTGILGRAGNGDYTALALTTSGAVLTLPIYDTSMTEGNRSVTREDNLSGSSDAFMKIGLVRDDALEAGARVSQDLDYMPLMGDNFGAVWITATDGAGNILAQIEDVAHASGDPGIQFLAIRNDSLGTFAGSNLEYSPVSVSSSGELWVRSFAAANFGVQVESGVNSIGKDEDAAHSTSDTGAFVLAIRDDTPSAVTSANGEYAAFTVDGFGGLYVRTMGAGGAAYVMTDNLDDTTFNAAFGTAGSADAQVISIQGVASMTPVTVAQSATVDFTIQMEDTDVAVGAPLFVRLSDGTAAVDPPIDDTATHTTGTTTLNAIGGVAVPTDTAISANDIGMFAMTLDRRQFVVGYGIQESGVVEMIDGSAETNVVDTNFMASTAITITGSGRLVQVCFFSSLDTILAVDGTLFFFDADPAILVNVADMTIAESQSVVAKVNVLVADYETDFPSTATACVEVDQSYHSISHVVYHNGGGVTWDDDDLHINVFYRQEGV